MRYSSQEQKQPTDQGILPRNARLVSPADPSALCIPGHAHPLHHPRLAQYIHVHVDGCWIWLGTISRKGYARIGVGPKTRSVHRMTYEMARGPIGDGLTIDHLCRTRRCVNPSHMEPVSNTINVLRGAGLTAENARKTHCIHGHDLSLSYVYRSTYLGHPVAWRQCRECNSLRKKAKRKSLRSPHSPLLLKAPQS